MIVLRTYRGQIEANSIAEFPNFVAALPDELRRVLLPTLEAQAQVFGVPLNELPRSARQQISEFGVPSDSDVTDGEILTDGASLCVVGVRQPMSPNRQQTMVFGDASIEASSVTPDARLHLYYIGPDLDWIHFAEIERLAAEVLGVTLEQYYFRSTAFEQLKAEARESPSRPSEQERDGATVLRDRLTRTLAIAIKSSGGLLVRDLARQLPADVRERTEDLQQLLRGALLVDSEIVVVCSKTQAQTARAASRELLAEMSARGLRCACGRPIAEERIEEALTLTDLGRTLLDKSRWMTILVVNELEAAGVPLDAILVEQQMGGDEIDCIANISGELVLFELKDKEFNLGSAYSFGAKIGIIRPNHSVIVSTERVGNDAKEHFRRAGLARGGRRRYRPAELGATDVQYIEGVDDIPSGIQRVASSVYIADARRIVDEVLPLASLDATGLLRLLARTPDAPTHTEMLIAALDQMENRNYDDDLPF